MARDCYGADAGAMASTPAGRRHRSTPGRRAGARPFWRLLFGAGAAFGRGLLSYLLFLATEVPPEARHASAVAIGHRLRGASISPRRRSLQRTVAFATMPGAPQMTRCAYHYSFAASFGFSITPHAGRAATHNSRISARDFEARCQHENAISYARSFADDFIRLLRHLSPKVPSMIIDYDSPITPISYSRRRTQYHGYCAAWSSEGRRLGHFCLRQAVGST